jgi:beta-apo-4'-carotenal oxygenase
MAKLPEFKATAVDAIPALCKEVRTSFLSHKTRPIEWRLKQLRKLYWGYGALYAVNKLTI